MLILHLAGRDDWRAARVSGEYRGSTRGASLADVGFVHASTAAQLAGVVDRFYAGVDLATLTVLVVDGEACEAAGSRLQWEVPPGASEAFPHIYGPIPVRAVVAALPIGRDPRGSVVLPDLPDSTWPTA